LVLNLKLKLLSVVNFDFKYSTKMVLTVTVC